MIYDLPAFTLAFSNTRARARTHTHTHTHTHHSHTPGGKQCHAICDFFGCATRVFECICGSTEKQTHSYESVLSVRVVIDVQIHAIVGPQACDIARPLRLCLCLSV